MSSTAVKKDKYALHDKSMTFFIKVSFPDMELF